ARHPQDHQTVARPRAQAAHRSGLRGAEGGRQRPPPAPALRHREGRDLGDEARGTANRAHRARAVRAWAGRARGRLPISRRHDQRRPPRRRAAVYRARRPRAADARLSLGGEAGHAHGCRVYPSRRTTLVVVLGDPRRIRALLSRFLFAEGYRVTTAETVADARAKLAGLRFDLLILDVMMPGETGFDLARDLRASSSVPIIMLTARDEAQSRIEGLTIGADDYVSKPFEPRELSLRIAGILRRARPPAAPAVESVRVGDFRFHLPRVVLRRGEEIVRLTDRERDMLRLLAATPGETVPRQTLAGNDGATGERAVDVQVNRLRRKIEHDPANPLLVQTVRGI